MEPEKLTEEEFYERVREVMAMFNQLRWLFLKAEGKISAVLHSAEKAFSAAGCTFQLNLSMFKF